MRFWDISALVPLILGESLSRRVRALRGELLRVHALRAADALQLAAAHLAADRVPRSLAFVSLDARLLEAAAREGFVIIEP